MALERQGNRITTSLHGRRFGLQAITTPISGGSRGTIELAVGVDAFREEQTTADTTSTNLRPFGVHYLASGTSAVFTIDPPIPGVRVLIMGSTSGPSFVKTANNETIRSTLGTSFTTIQLTSALVGGFELVGVTTAIWMSLGITSGTSSQASGYVMTTST